MGLGVVCGAPMSCTFGAAPSMLTVLPQEKTLVCSLPAATVMDNKPLLNILPFGMCSSMANPMVAAATAAAMGALTPMPCIPVTTAPWTPGETSIMIGNKPALTQDSRLVCNWGGSISFQMAGQMTVSYK